MVKFHALTCRRHTSSITASIAQDFRLVNAAFESGHSFPEKILPTGHLAPVHPPSFIINHPYEDRKYSHV